jgi:hypothetical protein
MEDIRKTKEKYWENRAKRRKERRHVRRILYKVNGGKRKGTDEE